MEERGGGVPAGEEEDAEGRRGLRSTAAAGAAAGGAAIGSAVRKGVSRVHETRDPERRTGDDSFEFEKGYRRREVSLVVRVARKRGETDCEIDS